MARERKREGEKTWPKRWVWHVSNAHPKHAIFNSNGSNLNVDRRLLVGEKREEG